MQSWLKVIGTSAQPFHDNWSREAPHLLTKASFPERGHMKYKPTVAPGGSARLPRDREAREPSRRHRGSRWTCQVPSRDRSRLPLGL